MFEHIPLMLAQEDAPPGPIDTPAQDQSTGQGTNQPLPGGSPPADEQPPTSPLGGLFPLLMVGLVLMVVFSMRGSSREKKRRQKMIAAIKKGDKVQTVGGILGTVVQVRDADIILKVDESTGAKISFSRSAVQSVVEEKED